MLYTRIEPLLYRVFSVDAAYRRSEYAHRYSIGGAKFLEMLRSKSPGFIHDNLRHLAFDYAEMLVEDATQALLRCSGATNLVLVLYKKASASVPEILRTMHLLRLAVDLSYLFDGGANIDFQHPLFAHLTHLEVFDKDPALTTVGIPRIPCLTHLAFHVLWDVNLYLAVLAQCPRLEVLAFIVHERFWGEEYGVVDPRFGDDVRTVVVAVQDFINDWEFGADGGADYWVRAERFIAQRRSGAVKGESHSAISCLFVS
jgi:hypothetical protein